MGRNDRLQSSGSLMPETSSHFNQMLKKFNKSTHECLKADNVGVL